MSETSKRSLRLAFLLIGVGTLFLLSNLDFLPYMVTDLLFGWQSILILVGAVFLTSPERRVPGVILLSVGTFFLTRELFEDHLNLDFLDWKFIWPLIFIVGGFMILAQRAGWLPNSSSVTNWTGEKEDTESGSEGDDKINVTAILGGGDLTFDSQEFRGGEITAIMGGGTYDFSNARLADTPQVLDITAIMGGASIIVPSDWKVRIEVTAIFGGFTDSRKRMSPPVEDPTQVLVIKGTVLFGGGEIKNFV